MSGSKTFGCLTAIVVFIVIISITCIFVFFYLPGVIVDRILSGKSIPGLSEEEVAEIRDAINEGVDEIESYGISRAAAIDIIEELKAHDIQNIINDGLESNLKDSSEFIDLVGNYIDLSDVDVDLLKSKSTNVTPDQIKEVLSSMNDNDNGVSFLLPTIKKIAVKLLKEE